MGYTYDLLPIVDNFKTGGGSKAMNVNGSVTPVVFSYAPGAGELLAMSHITLALKDEGATPFNVFGALGSALTNGIKIEAVITGTTHLIATIKDNADLCTRFTFSQNANGAVLSLLGISVPQGFGASNNIFIGSLHFDEPIVVVGDNGDSIKVTVQDNLTGVDILSMAYRLTELA